MKGLSLRAVEAIEKLIEDTFGSLALDFLGIVPKLTKEKKIVFSTSKNSLTSIFLNSLETTDPTKSEEETLKVLLRVADSYVSALENRTKSRVIGSLDSYIRNQDAKGQDISYGVMRDMVNKEMGQAKKHFSMIANTESNKASNVGTALQISKFGEEDPTVFFSVVIDDVTGTEEFKLHLLPDRVTPRVWKLSEIGSEYHKRGDSNPKFPGLHPHCFVGNQGVNILTEKDGYKNIKDIQIGDRVLTHTGKFKQVLNTLEWYDKKYYGKFIEIKYKTLRRDGEEVVTLKVTPEHQFMTQRGWVEAKDLKNTDKFRHLYTNCATCDKKTEVRPKRNYKEGLEGYFCSRKCKAEYQWKDDGHRSIVSEKNKKHMKEKWQNPTEEMYSAIRKANKATKKLIESGNFWAQKEENLEILQKNISKTNQKLQKNKTSKEELEVFDRVRKIFPSAKNQEILEKWCVDIFIPELNVNIEYDGGGHYLPVYTGKYTMESFLSKQEGRDIYLEKCGYHILRYSEIPSLDKIKEDVIRVSKNYKSEYFFEDIELISVKSIKNGKGGYRLYDLTVEDDESFVVNGIISHNCRCKLTYLAKGWGFDESGKIKYIEPDHDEFSSQRKKYGLPR